MKIDKKIWVYLPAIFASLLWSMPFAGIKIGLEYMAPFLFAGTRFMVAGLLVLFYASFRLRFRPRLIWEQRPPVKILMAVAFMQTFVMYTFYYVGLDNVPGAESAIIMGAAPLVVALLSHLIIKKDERLTLRKTVALVVGFSGIILMSLEKQFSVGADWFLGLGIFFLFISVVLGALSNIYVKMRPVKNILLLNGAQLFWGGVGLTLLSLIFEKEPFRIEGPLPFRFYAVFIQLCLISAVAFSLWYSVLQRPDVKVSELTLWKFLIPVCGAVISWILLPNEHFDWVSFGGMGVITASIIIYFSKP